MNGEAVPDPGKVTNPERITEYHAHIYYDPANSRDSASAVRDQIASLFPEARLGRWHDQLVGPHTRSMYQIAFPPALLPQLLPWMMLNRLGLTVLLHPVTGNDYVDHTDHAAWLGEVLPLRLDALRR